MYGTVRYDTVRYGTVRYGTVRYGTVRHSTVPSDFFNYESLYRYCLLRYSLVWVINSSVYIFLYYICHGFPGSCNLQCCGDENISLGSASTEPQIRIAAPSPAHQVCGK
jgi:hypothetical protein